MLWYGKSDRPADSKIVEEKLIELSNNVGKEGRQLLIDNFSDLASYYLPIFVANDKNAELLKGNCSKKRIVRAKLIHGLCDKVLTTKKYFSLLNEFIPEILSKILMQVQDPDEILSSLAKDESLELNYVKNLLTSNKVIKILLLKGTLLGTGSHLFPFFFPSDLIEWMNQFWFIKYFFAATKQESLKLKIDRKLVESQAGAG